MLTFVPADPREPSKRAGKLLLRVESEAIFQTGLHRMRGNLGNGRPVLQKQIDGLMVIAHVRKVGEGEQANRGIPSAQQRRAQLQLVIFRMRAVEVLL